MLVRVADWCYGARRLVVAGWVIALVGAFFLAGAFGGESRQDYLQPGSESKAAVETLERSFPQRAGDSIQIVIHSPGGVSAAAVQASAGQMLDDVARAEHVVDVLSPFVGTNSDRISTNGTTAYATVILDKTVNDYTAQEAAELVDPILASSDDAMRVEVGGPVAGLSQTPAIGSEGIGLIAAAIILLFTFGSAVAMGLPLLNAIFGLGVAMSLGEVLRRVVDVPDWAPSTAAMIGIGVGIDYALLIVTRFRGGLADGLAPRQATSTAMGTAGRAVVFAGLTVVISMLGILLMGQASMTGFALTVVLTVLVIMTASVTLLPAVLGFTGRHIERLHVPFMRRDPKPFDSSRWYRWSRFVQRRPWIAATGALAVLLALAAPFLGIRFGMPDAKNDPVTSTTRQAYELLADGFGPGFSAPLRAHPPGRHRTRTGQGRQLPRSHLERGPRRGLGRAGRRQHLRRHSGADTRRGHVPQDPATDALVDRLRDDVVPRADRWHRAEGQRGRHGARQPRHHPRFGRSTAAVLRRCTAHVLRPADDGVPLRRRSPQGRGDEPAGQRRSLRRAHRGRQRRSPR